MTNDYYQKSMRALQLAGMSERTQQCYTRSVRMLVDFYNKAPDQITEVQLQGYFLHRKIKGARGRVSILHLMSRMKTRPLSFFSGIILLFNGTTQ